MIQRVSPARVATLLGSALDRSPAYVGLADGLRLLITDGRITGGTRLPSERDLTAQLGVSRTTVSRAYSLLRERGYLASRQGSGSVATLPEPRGGLSDHLLSPGDVPENSLDLTCAASAAPPGIAAAYEAAVAELPSYLSGTGYYPSGLPELREVLARRYDERGLPTTPDQIVVTTGALAATAIAARALTGLGDRVLMESPTYPNAIATLRRAGARVVGAGVEPTGWDVEAMVAALRQVSPKAAYLIPDFHNPTGRLMGAGQRAEIARALRATRTTAIVDETLVELWLDGTPPPEPMGVSAPDTISVGSASKAFWGGLRIGWLRAPRERVGMLVSSRLSLDLGAPLLEQLVLCRLLRAPEALLAQRREDLRNSRDALLDALGQQLGDWRCAVPSGGLSLWCELPDALSSALSAAAERQGVLLAPGPSFAPEGGLERFVRVPYARRADELAEAVRRLALAWEDAQRHRTATSGRRPIVA
jgi:DNA-binding transcriptional MocR family regulator